MLSQGMLFCLLFTLSISICLFMYIHQKTSSIEKNIKNVVQFIQGIEQDVQGMHNRQKMNTDKVIVSDTEEINDVQYNNVHKNVLNHTNTEESDEDDEEDDDMEDSENDELPDLKTNAMFKNILESQTSIQLNDGVVDLNTSPLHEMFNIQVVKTFENQLKPKFLDRNELNSMTVNDLRKELRTHDSSISSYNAKKMKKNELVDKIQSYYESVNENENENDTDSLNTNIESMNENKTEDTSADIDSLKD